MVLDADERHRRRVVLTAEGGTSFLLDLPHATALHDGDGLVLEDGSIVRVAGKREPLVEITAADPQQLARLAWHIGNRHMDVQIIGDRLRIRRDHVLEEMLRGLGAQLSAIDAPFEPEPGAYGHEHQHSHMLTRSEQSAVPAKALAAETDGTKYALNPGALYRLMTWLSPAFPIGAFSYSSGIEWAVEAGDITDAATLREWLDVMIAEGGGFCDAVFFAHAYRATARRDHEALRAVAALAIALAPSKERHLETTAQGQAFLDMTRAAWPCARSIGSQCSARAASRFLSRLRLHAPGTAIPLEAAMHAYVHALAANLISSGVRLIPLGQSDGQRVLAALEPVVATTVARALVTALDDVGERGHARRSCQHASRDAAHPAVSIMSNPNGPLRVGVGGPVGSGKTALMDALCKAMRDRYEIAAITNDIYTKWDAEYLVRSGALPAGANRGRGDRRLSAYRHPRGCFHQSRRRRPDAEKVSVARSHPDRIRRRQSRRNLFAGARRYHHLRHRRRRRRQDTFQRRPRHHALRSSGHQQGGSRAACRRLARRDERDARRMRGQRPFVFSNLRAGDGVGAIARFIEESGGLRSAGHE